ncbi:MAG: hypothetical protein VB089_15235 [Anaerolineaceae bacterium]|jgi:hypothetical protein|nr:hypothetical protein [Anaerolineaceae bacterium]
MHAQNKPNQYYQIVIKGHLDAAWQDWFDDLALERTADDQTILSGVIVDQAALHGVLKKINNLGLTLVAVTSQDAPERKNPVTQEVNSRQAVPSLDLSFHQKSAAVSLFVISVAAIHYFVQVLPMRSVALAGTPIPEGYAALVLGTLGLVVLTQIGLQIVLVIGHGSAPKAGLQEQLAALKARRNAYMVMMVGVLAVLGLLFVNFPAFCMANFAVLSLLLAEITHYASQLFYYRRVN